MGKSKNEEAAFHRRIGILKNHADRTLPFSDLGSIQDIFKKFKEEVMEDVLALTAPFVEADPAEKMEDSEEEEYDPENKFGIKDEVYQCAQDFFYSLEDVLIEPSIKMYYMQGVCRTLRDNFTIVGAAESLRPIASHIFDKHTMDTVERIFASDLEEGGCRTRVLRTGVSCEITLFPNRDTHVNLLKMKTAFGIRQVCLDSISDNHMVIIFLLEKPAKKTRRTNKTPSQPTIEYTNVTLDEVLNSGEFGSKIRAWIGPKIRAWIRGESTDSPVTYVREESFVSYNDSGLFEMTGPLGYVSAQLLVSGQHSGLLRISSGKKALLPDEVPVVYTDEFSTRQEAPEIIARVYWNNVVLPKQPVCGQVRDVSDE